MRPASPATVFVLVAVVVCSATLARRPEREPRITSGTAPAWRAAISRRQFGMLYQACRPIPSRIPKES